MAVSLPPVPASLIACVLVGAGLACERIAADPAAPCASDADCTIHCGGMCCAPDCPCATAVSTAEAARLDDEARRRCSDAKMTCPLVDRDACDWDARFAAVCSAGACVAEAVAGGAAPEMRVPPTPERYGVSDDECRLCRRWEGRPGKPTNACAHLVEWPCTGDRACRMKAPRDAACCDARASEEVGIDVAPWGPYTARSSKPSPPPGLLVAVAEGRIDAASGGLGRTTLVFAEPAPDGMIVTDLEVSRGASVAWIDGTRDVVVGGSRLERISFPTRARVELIAGVYAVAGLDVSPTGERLAFAGPAGAQDSRFSLEILDLHTRERVTLTAAVGDTHPRWSPDGAQLVFQGRGEPGRLGVVATAERRVSETIAAEQFLRPIWHPGGGFLLAWQRRDASCRLVLVAPDRRRFAATELAVEARPARGYAIEACGDLAVSPNGTHVAFWRPAGAEDQLMMASLAWPDARVELGTVGQGGAIDWSDGVRRLELGLPDVAPQQAK